MELDPCLDKGLELMAANTHCATAGVFGGCDHYCVGPDSIVGAGVTIVELWSLLWGCVTIVGL